jgi:murein DD-endopeptidase MepM/ murein hydrolase activator NlpD
MSFETDFSIRLLNRLGKPVTTQAVKNLVGWMKAEGGHTHNSARWNPLNTTQNMPGSGDTGQQGNISVYRDINQGVEATAITLRNGRYNSILQNLGADPNTFVRSVTSSPWGTKSNFSSLISGAPVPSNLSRQPRQPAVPGAPRAQPPYTGPSAVGVGNPATAVIGPLNWKAIWGTLAANQADIMAGRMPPTARLDALVRQISKAIKVPIPVASPAGLPGMPGAAPAVPAAPAGPSGGAMVEGAIPGSPVPGQKFHASTHQTSGLPGYPAFDYMAPAGTKVVAPVSGTVFKLSGKDPSLGGSPGGPLGYSIYIMGSDGRSYFLTHLDRVGVKLKQKVRQGQQIAVVAAGPRSWSSPHVHMGVHGG